MFTVTYSYSIDEMKQEENLTYCDPVSPSRRPKRSVSHKTSQDSDNGLLWREEKEIKKALYASLNDSKKTKLSEQEGDEAPKPKTKATNGEPSPKKARVHAQRKFAQGSTPNSPIPTPVKMCPNANVAVDLFPYRRPKTEDFLTFLCLRGTPILPPSLDFFNNWSKEDAASEKSYVSETDLYSKDAQGTSESSFHRQTAVKLAAFKKKLGSDAKPSSHQERLRSAPSSKRKLLQDDNTSNYFKKAPVSKLGNHEQTKSSVSVLKEKYKKQMLQRRNNPVCVNSSSKRPIRNIAKVESTTKSVTRSSTLIKNNVANRTSPNTKQAKSCVSAKKKHCSVPIKDKPKKISSTKTSVSKKVETRKDIKAAKDNRPKEEIKMSLEKKRSLRSASVPVSVETPPNILLSRLRKAKLVPPIVDMESDESDFEDVECKLPTKVSNKVPKQKSHKLAKLSVMQQQSLISRQHAVEHSYVKLSPPAIEKPKTTPTKLSKTLKQTAKLQLVKNSQKVVNLKPKALEISKPVTRSSRLKDSLMKTALKSAKHIATQRRNPRTAVQSESARGRFRERRLANTRSTISKNAKYDATKKNHVLEKERKHHTAKRKTNESKMKVLEQQKMQTRKMLSFESGNSKNVPKKFVESKKQNPSKLKSEAEESDKRDSSFLRDVASPSNSSRIGNIQSKSSVALLKEDDDDDDYSMLTDTDESSPKPSYVHSLDSNSEPVNNGRSSSQENQPVDNISESAAFIIENMTENVGGFDTISNDMAAALPGELMFGNAEEIQGLMTTEFSGVFDGAILLTTRDSLSQVPLHFIQDIAMPRSMADAATNTCEEDILACMHEEVNRSEEMSVGTQTVSPIASPEASVPPPSPAIQTVQPQLEKSPNKEQMPTEVTSSPQKLKSKKNKSFPGPKDPPKIVEAPVYTPTLEEFKDPLEFIEKIQSEAEIYGICRIVPPSSFKPECKVNDDMRFTAYNQYIHKMFRRWGPNVQHVSSIRKHLTSQGITLQQSPLIGGMELDLSRLYHTVQHCGGLRQVIEKKKWQRVADAMHIPKTAQDRVNKLYDTYCKYLVSYDTLPKEEKDKLQQEVIGQHQRRLEQKDSKSDEEYDEESNECVTKGRSIALSAFYRIARNTMSMWYRNEPTPDEVERDYWKLVSDRQRHVVVHAGNIDSSVYGSGFPSNRGGGQFCKHPWNLKVLTNNSGSVLRSMGPVSGITIPTLHVGMLYTTGCWYRDPHALPWIEYLHTGASKIWYGIPASTSKKFGNVMREVMPSVCTNNPIWLPSDSAMLPPNLLVENDVSLSRTVQESGQFVVIFPGAFTSSICTGYIVSESVYFAPPWWLDNARQAFQEIEESCEPPMFSLERLLFSIASDSRSQLDTLQKLLPHLQKIRERELSLRQQLADLGLKNSERLHLLDVRDGKKRKQKGLEEEGDLECEMCRTLCYVSMVVNSQEDTVYCLKHCCQYVRRKKSTKSLKLVYTYNEDELNEVIRKVTEQIQLQSEKMNAKKKVKKKLSP